MSFLQLPIDASEGFPQAFRLAFGGRTYRFQLYANIAEELLDVTTGPLDLPAVGAFLVLGVDREDSAGPTTILLSKLVTGIEYQAAELVLTFPTMRLDPRNLNGVGSFGSQVVGGVDLR